MTMSHRICYVYPPQRNAMCNHELPQAIIQWQVIVTKCMFSNKANFYLLKDYSLLIFTPVHDKTNI